LKRGARHSVEWREGRRKLTADLEIEEVARLHDEITVNQPVCDVDAQVCLGVEAAKAATPRQQPLGREGRPGLTVTVRAPAAAPIRSTMLAIRSRAWLVAASSISPAAVGRTSRLVRRNRRPKAAFRARI
jgi:hypothetical protein